MNKMAIIGNLTKDPELRVTSSGVNVCSFTVAVNRRKRGQNGEELPAMFYRVTAWRQLAEICGKYLKKGSKVYADGDLSVNTYQANNGETRFSLEIECQNVEFLSSVQANNQENESMSMTANVPVTPQPVPHQVTYTEVQTDELPF